MSFLKKLGGKKDVCVCRAVSWGSHVQDERNKADDKILDATLANDPAKLKTLIAAKKHTSLSKADDEGRIPCVM
jgi:hypothetical protein